MAAPQDDTQPRAPQGLREALAQAKPSILLEDTQPTQSIAPRPAPRRWGAVLALVASGGMAACLCLSITGLAFVAGLSDELSAIGTQSAATENADLATQYALGQADFEAGRYELAVIRLEYVETARPNYQEAGQRLQEAQLILSYTPTPSPSPSPSATPLLPPPSPAPQSQATPSGLDPAQMFGLAQSAMTVSDYEEAIRWLEALVLLDPNYRRAETQDLRLTAYLAQGRIYLRGQNSDGLDRLARGVQLINRASEIGTVPGDLLYEADFVARYLAARAYVEGGAYAQAREVLLRLCEEDCDWSYRGLSVRILLAQAGG